MSSCSDKSPLLTINVKCGNALSVRGKAREITMLPFTASSDGPFFFGETVGDAIDTQTKNADGFFLSARYMLEGRDFKGTHCRVFIENNGDFEKGFTPTITTDSNALSNWEELSLFASVEPSDGGVTIRIFEKQ